MHKLTLKETEGAIENGQSRNTETIGQIRHRANINKRQNHNTIQKTKMMSNTEIPK